MAKVRSSKNKASDVESVKIKMFIKNRFGVIEMLPKQGSILDQSVARDITSKVLVSQAEKEKVGLKQEGNSYSWDETKEKGKTIEFSRTEIVFLNTQVKRMDKEKTISKNTLDVCLKIQAVS